MHSFIWGRHLDLDGMAPSLWSFWRILTIVTGQCCFCCTAGFWSSLVLTKLTSSNITDEHEVLVIFFYINSKMDIIAKCYFLVSYARWVRTDPSGFLRVFPNHRSYEKIGTKTCPGLTCQNWSGYTTSSPSNPLPPPPDPATQRVLNDLERTMLYCGRMIRLLAHPLPPSPPARKLSLFLSLPLCSRTSLLAGEAGRGRARSQSIRPQENLALSKSFNTLYTYSYNLRMSFHFGGALYGIRSHECCHVNDCAYYRYTISHKHLL
jgi:hypothetical protein